VFFSPARTVASNLGFDDHLARSWIKDAASIISPAVMASQQSYQAEYSIFVQLATFAE
jgi:hypothetical protein